MVLSRCRFSERFLAGVLSWVSRENGFSESVPRRQVSRRCCESQSDVKAPSLKQQTNHSAPDSSRENLATLACNARTRYVFYVNIKWCAVISEVPEKDARLYHDPKSLANAKRSERRKGWFWWEGCFQKRLFLWCPWFSWFPWIGENQNLKNQLMLVFRNNSARQKMTSKNQNAVARSCLYACFKWHLWRDFKITSEN